MRLLFTGGGGSAMEAVFRLFDGPHVVYAADADIGGMPPQIPADRKIRVPFAQDSAFVKTMAALCRDMEIDLLIPGVDEELPQVPEIVARAGNLRALIPPADFVTTMMDKLRSMHVLAELGIPVPRTGTAEAHTGIPMPCILKPRRGHGSRGVHIANSPAEINAYQVLYGCSAEDVLVQEHLSGQEYTVMMAATADGKLRAVVPVKVEIKRGVTIRAHTENHPRVIAACRCIHEILPTGGCYNIQLILTPDGRALPFEINPRISTTFVLGVAAGIDPIAIFLDGTSPNSADLLPFRDGVRLRRNWQNTFEDPARC